VPSRLVGRALLEMTRSGSLSPKNNGAWEQDQYVEHLVRLAKARGFRGGAEERWSRSTCRPRSAPGERAV